jgi:hypothetical protein
MQYFIIIWLIVLSILLGIEYTKQKRLNRLLLHLFYNSPDKKHILDHLYFKDTIKLKKDMNTMINADIDISELEKALKKNEK